MSKKKKKPAWERKKKPCSGFCDFCKKEINFMTGHYCSQCRRWFCEEHKHPQDHNCIGLPKPVKREISEIHSKGYIYVRK
jgi:predicted nucleic acid binding AN1-type Zn finger protein